MKKHITLRPFLNAALALLLLTLIFPGCKKQDRFGTISLSFAEALECSPVSSAQTRGTSVIADTNSFVLKISNTGGDTVYSGAYGSRPEQLEVSAGTYEIEVYSIPFPKPAFDSPQYGDRQVVVVSNGKNVDVRLLCKMTNAAVELKFADSFKKKYSAGRFILRQSQGSLEYSMSETRAGYFMPGNLEFVYQESGTEEIFFNRVLVAGEYHKLTLNASGSTSSAGFSIGVDTTKSYIVEDIIVGPGYAGADGKTKETAYDIATASQHLGDTLWVWGYIVGGDLTTSGISFDAPFAKSSNLAIASSPTVKDRSQCFSVELSKAAIKADLNLVDNPGNIGRKVFLRGLAATYFSIPGLKSVTDYSF